jgi:hypothetical protein
VRQTREDASSRVGTTLRDWRVGSDTGLVEVVKGRSSHPSPVAAPPLLFESPRNGGRQVGACGRAAGGGLTPFPRKPWGGDLPVTPV